MELDGQVAIVTGGGSGVGAAVARQLGAAGARVVVVGRRAEQLAATCAAVAGPHPARAVAADITDRAQVKALVEQVLAELGRVDVLVNNAGDNVVARRLAELAPEDWDRLLAVNATGAFNLIQALLPQMRAQGGGLVINISSVSGLRASSLAGAAYSASKHALHALAYVLGQEEEQHGIRATLIAPGEINTALLDKRPVAVSPGQRARLLQPDDVAAAVLFVARLPAHVSVPELVIKPVGQPFG